MVILADALKPGDALKLRRPIRSHKTGLMLPLEGLYVSRVENLGRWLILVNFGQAGEEYVFPDDLKET